MDASELILSPSPFSITANPRFFYTNPSHEEGYGKLLATLRQRGGLLLLTGEPGTGKTTFLRKLSLSLDETAHVTFFPCAAPTFQDILAHLCEQCGISGVNSNPWTQFSLLHNYLHAWNQHGGLEVLFLDEAQHLSTETLDQLSSLANLEGPNGKLLQIVLAGHPELEQTLASATLRHLQQRIATHYRLLPLATEEVEAFIHYRLRTAGSPRLDLFTTEAAQAIAGYSSGIPRLINVICEAALGAATRAGLYVVTADIILQVAQTLRLSPPSTPQLDHEPANEEMPSASPDCSAAPQPPTQPTAPLLGEETTPDGTQDESVVPQSMAPKLVGTQRRFLALHQWRQQAVGLSLSVFLAWLSAQFILLYVGQSETALPQTPRAARNLSSAPTPHRDPVARTSDGAPGKVRTLPPRETSQTVVPPVSPVKQQLPSQQLAPQPFTQVPPLPQPSSPSSLPVLSSSTLSLPAPALQAPPPHQKSAMTPPAAPLRTTPDAADQPRQSAQLSPKVRSGEESDAPSPPRLPSQVSATPSSAIAGRASRDQPNVQSASFTRASPGSVRKAEARARLASLGLTTTPATLLKAAENGSLKTVALLLQAGVSPNGQNKQGWTALMFAAQSNSLDIVEKLLAYRAQPNTKNETGATALIIAARSNHAAITQALLRRGATVNATDRQGRTALMHAAEMGHAVTVRTLLNNGANPRMVNHKGWTALRHASQGKKGSFSSSPVHANANTPGLLQRFGKLWEQTVRPDNFDEVVSLLQQAEMRHYSRRN